MATWFPLPLRQIDFSARSVERKARAAESNFRAVVVVPSVKATVAKMARNDTMWQKVKKTIGNEIQDEEKLAGNLVGFLLLRL